MWYFSHILKNNRLGGHQMLFIWKLEENHMVATRWYFSQDWKKKPQGGHLVIYL